MHTVSWYSQYESFSNPDHQRRGCGIVSLKIVLEYWDSKYKNVLADELFEKGVAAGAYQDSVGWRHAGLAALARTYGFDAYNRDYAPQSPTPMSLEGSFEELKKELEYGPVVASVWLRFDPSSGSGHMVVVAGVVGDVVSISDPAGRSQQEGMMQLSVADFLRGFRQRYVVVRPLQ